MSVWEQKQAWIKDLFHFDLSQNSLSSDIKDNKRLPKKCNGDFAFTRHSALLWKCDDLNDWVFEVIFVFFLNFLNFPAHSVCFPVPYDHSIISIEAAGYELPFFEI